MIDTGRSANRGQIDRSASLPPPTFARSGLEMPPTAEIAGERVVLQPRGEEIMRALAPVVLGSLMPAEHGSRARALEAAMATMDDYLAHLSLPLQRQAGLLLGTLALLPVRFLLLRTWRRWCDVAPERIERFLMRARSSRFFLMRRSYDFLQSMIVLAWFDLPTAWTEIGYPGPPVERPPRQGQPW